MRHRFAAILAADVAHFSGLMESDSEATVHALQECRAIFERCIAANHGRVFGSVGDSLMAEFSGPVEALRAAKEIQAALLEANLIIGGRERLQVRIGLHAGDVIGNEDNVFGDVVNTASRLQEIARPGGIVLSAFVHEQVRKERDFVFRSLGRQRLKNILEPVTVFEVEQRHRAINWRRIRLTLLPYKGPAAALLGAIIAGALLVGYFESRKPGIGPTIEVPSGVDELQVDTDSIAVLPFDNMSADPGQEYFSDGISEEILNLLARIESLKVIARHSSFSFKGKDIDIATMAEQMNVRYILEGSVRRSGDRVRINAQLIDAKDSIHLWSESYDRELDDIFAVQDEISAAITESLKEHLGLQVSTLPRVVATPSTEAYEAYLRGRYLVAQRTHTGIEGAVREFEKAIVLDPDYALAHAELAFCIILLEWYRSLTNTEAIARAAPHAARAMALDPSLAEAHYVTGLLWDRRGDPEQTLKHWRQAIQINPNFAQVYVSMGNLMRDYFGRYDESFAMTEMALRLDPLSIPAHVNHVRDLIFRNRLDEADREIEKLAAISPSWAANLRGFRMSVGGNWANILLGGMDSLRIEPNQGSLALEWGDIYFAIIGLEKEALTISDAKLPHRLKILRRHGEAVTTAEATLAEDPTDFAARRRLGLALAGGGEYERARPILEDAWQRSGGRVTSEGLFIANYAAALIAIRRDAGEEAGVGEIIAAMRDNVRRYREADIIRGDPIFDNVDYEEGLAAYLSGEHERGLALIAKAVEEGIFILPWEAYLQGLYDDPDFAPIRAKQEARQVREREKFLAIVCNDNPYEAVWQPAGGTCEQFAAAQAN